MNPNHLEIGNTVEDSPVGPGTITGITDAGYPQVNRVAVGCLRRTDGVVFDPSGAYKKKPNHNPPSSTSPSAVSGGGES